MEDDPQPWQRRVTRHLPVGVLIVTTAGLGAGAALHLDALGQAGNLVWDVVGTIGAAYALSAMVESLRHARLGVDAIALLALVGALAVGEHLAAAVVSVMLASGRSLEAWAAGRARRDVSALLERSPRSAHRYAEEGIATVAVDQLVPGDLVMVASGELVPVDGRLSGAGVLDESALTGEPLPVEWAAGDAVRSGVANAGGPFDMRVTATATENTYAGIVRLVQGAEAAQPPFVRLADRYALLFLLVSVAGAGIAWGVGGAVRAIVVLVVATPCPLTTGHPRLGAIVTSGSLSADEVLGFAAWRPARQHGQR